MVNVTFNQAQAIDHFTLVLIWCTNKFLLQLHYQLRTTSWLMAAGIASFVHNPVLTAGEG